MTLSYTAVTIAALLTVELFLFGALSITVVVLLNSGLLPAQLIETAMLDNTSTFRSFLTETPPDQQGIADVLELIATVPPVAIPFTFEANDKLLVVDHDGRLLGTGPEALVSSAQIGQPLDAEAIPGLAAPLQAALSGEEDIKQLYTSARPGEIVVMAVPIWDEANEQVIGALLAAVENPSIMEIIGDLIQLLGISLLFITLFAALVGTAFGFVAARGLVQRLDRLAVATQAWSQGNFTVSVADQSGDELGQLAHRLNNMALELQNLVETRRKLVITEERNRLARDLHDSAKQQAFAVAAQINAARIRLKHEPDAAEAHLEEAEKIIDALRQELTNLIQELRPSALEGSSLGVAIREVTADWARQNGIALVVTIKAEKVLPLAVEQALFRIMQEALANVTRHSQATQAEIALIVGDKEVTLTVRDNGRGFDVDGQSEGFGLRSMRERAGLVGGILSLKSLPGEETSVSCIIPLDQSGENGDGR